MAIKKSRLDNGIIYYHGSNSDFYYTLGFGCICDSCNRKMLTTYYYPILGSRGVCPLCHQEIVKRHGDKELVGDEEHYQRMLEERFDRRIQIASVHRR